MRQEITTIVLAVLAIASGIVAYLRDPGRFVLVRVIPSLAFRE